jgi:hypothetical protein
MEERMTKLALLGAAAVLTSVLAGPAMAQHAVAHPGSYIEETGTCPGREAGNPYTPQEDYMAWSGWRARGGWDDRNDLNCLRGSRWRHHAAGF